jgi:hypothetical protein
VPAAQALPPLLLPLPYHPTCMHGWRDRRAGQTAVCIINLRSHPTCNKDKVSAPAFYLTRTCCFTEGDLRSSSIPTCMTVAGERQPQMYSKQQKLFSTTLVCSKQQKCSLPK